MKRLIALLVLLPLVCLAQHNGPYPGGGSGGGGTTINNTYNITNVPSGFNLVANGGFTNLTITGSSAAALNFTIGGGSPSYVNGNQSGTNSVFIPGGTYYLQAYMNGLSSGTNFTLTVLTNQPGVAQTASPLTVTLTANGVANSVISANVTILSNTLASINIINNGTTLSVPGVFGQWSLYMQVPASTLAVNSTNTVNNIYTATNSLGPAFILTNNYYVYGGLTFGPFLDQRDTVSNAFKALPQCPDTQNPYTSAGDAVYFMPGVHQISGTLFWPPTGKTNSTLTLYGAGMTASILSGTNLQPQDMFHIATVIGAADYCYLYVHDLGFNITSNAPGTNIFYLGASGSGIQGGLAGATFERNMFTCLNTFTNAWPLLTPDVGNGPNAQGIIAINEQNSSGDTIIIQHNFLDYVAGIWINNPHLVFEENVVEDCGGAGSVSNPLFDTSNPFSLGCAIIFGRGTGDQMYSVGHNEFVANSSRPCGYVYLGLTDITITGDDYESGDNTVGVIYTAQGRITLLNPQYNKTVGGSPPKSQFFFDVPIGGPYGSPVNDAGNSNCISVVDFSRLYSGPSTSTSYGFIVQSNNWNLQSFTNGMNNWDLKYSVSNGIPVIIYNSNGVIYVSLVTPKITGISGIVQTNIVGAITGTNCWNYTVPSGVTNSYTIVGYLTVTALSLDVIQPKVVWTDENGSVQTLSLGSSISATGYNNLPSTFIRAKGGTVIFVTNSVTTGTGSITYNIEAHLNGVTTSQ